MSTTNASSASRFQTHRDAGRDADALQTLHGRASGPMGARLLQINYRLNVPIETFRREFGPAARDIADVPGLRWKLWIAGPGRSEGGGIYVFDDEAALDAYLNGPIVAALRSHPAFSDLSVKQFEILADESAVTRGPVGTAVEAANR